MDFFHSAPIPKFFVESNSNDVIKKIFQDRLGMEPLQQDYEVRLFINTVLKE
jgi:hypothetical protein